MKSSRRFMAGIIMFLILSCVWLIVYLPPYEKIVYSKSTPCSYGDVDKNPNSSEGYQAGTDIPVINASDASQSAPHESDVPFVLKINAKNLKPMNIYRPASYNTTQAAYLTNALQVMLLRTWEDYGEYYLASFANGDKIPVFLNNRTLKIPHSGEFTLPIGRMHIDSNLAMISGENLTDEWYINAATGFTNSPDMKKLHDIKNIAAAILMIAAFIVVIIRMIIIQVHRHNT